MNFSLIFFSYQFSTNHLFYTWSLFFSLKKYYYKSWGWFWIDRHLSTIQKNIWSFGLTAVIFTNGNAGDNKPIAIRFFIKYVHFFTFFVWETIKKITIKKYLNNFVSLFNTFLFLKQFVRDKFQFYVSLISDHFGTDVITHIFISFQILLCTNERDKFEDL